MSMAFVPSHMRGKTPPTQASIQKMLDENNQLIQTIVDYQNRGKAQECVQYQQILHRNLVYLATIADSNQNVQLQALIPAAGQSNQNPQPGGMMGQQRPQQPIPNQMQPNMGKGALPANNQMMMGNPQAPYNAQNQPQQQPQMAQPNNFNPAMSQQPSQQGVPPTQTNMMNQAGRKISRSTSDQLSSKINSKLNNKQGSIPMNNSGQMPGHPNYGTPTSQQQSMTGQNNFGAPLAPQAQNMMNPQGRKMNWSGTVAEQLSSKLNAKQNAQNKGQMINNQNNMQAPFNSMGQQSSGFPNQQQPMMSQSQPMMSQQSNMNPQMMSQGNTQSTPMMSRGQMPPPSSYRRSPSTGPQFQGQGPQNFNNQPNQQNFPQANFNQGNIQGQFQYQNQQGYPYRGQNPMQAQMSRPMGQGQMPNQIGQSQLTQGQGQISQMGSPMSSSMQPGQNTNGQGPGSQMPNQISSRMPNMNQNPGQMHPNMAPAAAGQDSSVPNSMPPSSLGQMSQPLMSGPGQMTTSPNMGSQMPQGGQMQQQNISQNQMAGQIGGQIPNQGQQFGYNQNQF